MIRLRDAPAGRPAGVGPVVLPVGLSPHDVTLVELVPAADWAPPRSGERRRPGREAA